MVRWKVAALVLGLLVLACGTTGGATPGITPGAAALPAATAAPAQIAKVGDRVEQGGIALTVVKTERKDALSDFQKAKADHTFLIAEVVIENIGTAKTPYNVFYFTAKDGDGFEYNPAIGVEQAFQSGDLDAGGKARGNVAFEVKTAAAGLVLEYKPIVIGADAAIRVALD